MTHPIHEYIDEILRMTYGQPPRSPDAFEIAERLGVDRRPSLEPRNPANPSPSAMAMSVRDYKRPGDWVVFHDQTARLERQQFDVAHEILEQRLLDEPALVDELAPNIDPADRDAWRAAAHEIACWFTKDALIPPDRFAEDWAEYGPDLRRIKELYPRASHELLAYAALQAHGTGLIVTIVDEPHGEPRRLYRRLHGQNLPFQPPPAAEERAALNQCFATGAVERSRVEVEWPDWGFAGPVELAATPVFEPEWLRVILLTILPDEYY